MDAGTNFSLAGFRCSEGIIEDKLTLQDPDGALSRQALYDFIRKKFRILSFTVSAKSSQFKLMKWKQKEKMMKGNFFTLSSH